MRVLRGILSGDGGQPTCSNDVGQAAVELQQQRAARLVVATGGGIVETPEVNADCISVCNMLLL